MQVIKKINNNVAVCKDGNGHELIAIGKGIGFQTPPYELEDMSRVQRTFYNIAPKYLSMMETIPYDVIEFSAEVVDIAGSTLPYELSPNLVLTLADHISFAIERKEKGIYVRMPLVYDLEQTYPGELRLSRQVLVSIWRRFRVRLPEDEAAGIAMAFVNARVYGEKKTADDAISDDGAVLENITDIVEREMKIKVERRSFHYARYATHVLYLLKRLRQGLGIETVNQDIYEPLRLEYADTASCVDRITEYLMEKWGVRVTGEEQLYLLLHINRVCSSEGL